MNNSPLWSPQDVAERFLHAVADGDYDIAEQLLAKDVVYTRMSRRTLRGRGAVGRHLRRHARSTVVLETVLLSSGRNDGVALAERGIAAARGPLRVRFWVCARFEVSGGRIVAWRDYVDTVDLCRATLRALAGTVYAPARWTLPRAAV